MSCLMITLALLFSQCDKPQIEPNDDTKAVISEIENPRPYNDILQEIGKINEFSGEVAGFNRRDSSTDGITFTGSSTITIWGTLSQDFPLYTVRNHGIGGSWLTHIIAHGENLIFYNRPAVVILYIGDNDAYYLSIDTFKSYINSFAWNFRQRLPESSLIFLTVKPSPSRVGMFSYYEKVNRHLKLLAANIDKLYCVDIWTPIKEGNALSYFTPDMLHLNRKGYELIISKLSPVLDSIMKE